MKRRLIVALALLALLVSQRIPVAAQTDSGIIRVLLAPIQNLDPLSLAKGDLGGRDLVENLFVGLVRYNPQTGAFDKLLAKEWTVSADGLTWTFRLRTDIQWVRLNGDKIEAMRPITPGDFVTAIRRACDQTAPNPATPSIFIIAGCATVSNANPAQVNDIFIARNLKVAASGADKLEITFAYPTSYTDALLALPEFRPMPREAISKNPLAWATQTETLLTNGPYAVKAWTNGELTLTRNPFWPDQFAGDVTDLQIVSSGAADIARSSKAAGESAKFVQSVTVLGFSTERAGMNSDPFRRALSLAIDRTALAAIVDPVLATPVNWLLNTGGALTLSAPDAGKIALAASPYAGCNRLPDKFEIGIDAQPQSAAIAQALIAGWNKTLGCNPTSFTVRAYDAARLLGIVRGAVNVDENQKGAPRPQLWIASWSPDYLARNAWISDALHCQFGFLRSALPCGKADELMIAAGVEADPAARKAQYDQIEALLFNPTNGSFPVAPLYRTAVTVVNSGRITASELAGGEVAPFRFDLWKKAAPK